MVYKMFQKMSCCKCVIRHRWFWPTVVILCIVLIVVIVVSSLTQYPRSVLLSDATQAKKIVVEWTLPAGPDGYQNFAFELSEEDKAKILSELDRNLKVDYFRARATLPPTIGLYLFNDKNEVVACYGIRYARGPGRCPSMESIRQIAKNGRRLSEIEVDMLTDARYPSKWPAIIPGRYDFVLPVTKTDADVDPIREEIEIAAKTLDPAIRYRLTGHTGDIHSVACSPDGKTAASGSWEVMLWDLTTGKNIASLHGHTGWISSLAFSPDGKMLVSGGGGNDDITVRLWDMATMENIAIFKGHREGVATVAFSPDGKTIASGSWDDTIKLWNIATGKCIRTFTGHNGNVDSLVFSSDGKTIASGSGDKAIKIWDVSSGRCTMTLKGHDSYVGSVAFSPTNSEILASGSGDSTIRLWNTTTGVNLKTLKFPTTRKTAMPIVFSPDGNTLVSGGRERKMMLWDVNSGKIALFFSGHSMNAKQLASSVNGKILVSFAGNSVTVWDMAKIAQRLRQNSGKQKESGTLLEGKKGREKRREKDVRNAL